MKNKYWLIGIFSILTLIIAYVVFVPSDTEDDSILITAKRGDFLVEITTSGELEARNSVKIMGPSGLRAARIWRVEIRDIVDEGTQVKKGDYVAQLDQTELQNNIQSRQTEFQQSSSQYVQTKLDTALELRKARDELINLKFAVEEKEIVLSQSQYEPPAAIKQAEIEVEKAKRAYNQALENYTLQQQKAVAQMDEAAAEMMEDKNELDQMQRVLAMFTVKAPEDGMVIYEREWNGTKKGVGAFVEAWNPVVATLPDLRKMISRTYVNEVDIRSVRAGQSVSIGLDAFPDKKLTGRIIDVANVGEQRPNSDAKVFMVIIEIIESDNTLRPSMTTSNRILAEKVEDVLFIPLECLHNQGDSLTYVIRKDGLSFRRQQVEIGKTNANDAIVLQGVDEGDQLYLSIPQGVESSPLTLLETTVPNVAESGD